MGHCLLVTALMSWSFHQYPKTLRLTDLTAFSTAVLLLYKLPNTVQANCTWSGFLSNAVLIGLMADPGGNISPWGLRLDGIWEVQIRPYGPKNPVKSWGECSYPLKFISSEKADVEICFYFTIFNSTQVFDFSSQVFRCFVSPEGK